MGNIVHFSTRPEITLFSRYVTRVIDAVRGVYLSIVLLASLKCRTVFLMKINKETFSSQSPSLSIRSQDRLMRDSTDDKKT